MHPQLQLVSDEYRSAQARLHDLVRAVPDEQWSKRSAPARWSVAECVAHLNITSLAYVPLLQHAVSRARMLERRSPSRYRRSEEHTSELQSRLHLVCRLLLENTTLAAAGTEATPSHFPAPLHTHPHDTP